MRPEPKTRLMAGFKRIAEFSAHMTPNLWD